MWVWNAGHKFARLDFISTGQPRGFPVHLGSTGCKPNTTKTTIPTSCSEPNRVEEDFAEFDIEHDAVIADLAALLSTTDVDTVKGGCMSAPDAVNCANLFPAFGLPFGGNPAPVQRFFRRGPYATANETSSKLRQN
jgi:uncharacterized repeat protein (TIGR04052 family)